MENILREKGKDLFLVNVYKFAFHKNLANGVKRWYCPEFELSILSSPSLVASYLKYKGMDSDIGSFLSIFFGLPLLPPEHVVEFFTEELMID